MIPQRRSAWSSEASRRNSGAVMLLPGGRSGGRAMARVMTDQHRTDLPYHCDTTFLYEKGRIQVAYQRK